MGLCTVVAVAEQQESDGSVPLVQFDPASPAAVECYSGQTVELPCKLTQPAQLLHWLRNEATVIGSESDGDYLLSANGSLVIRSFRTELKGSYRCVATADGGITKQVAPAIAVTSFSE